MNFDPVLLAARMGPMKERGLWRDETIDVYVRRALEHCPDRPAIVGYRQGETKPVRLSYRELDERVDRIARSLAALGVERGDVVTFQLPNRWEFIALSLACVRIGAAANPVMPIFRQHELNFMLNFGEFEGVRRAEDLPPVRPRGHGARHDARPAPSAAPGDRGRRGRGQLRGEAAARRRAAAQRAGARSGRCDAADVHLGHHGGAQGGDAHVEHPVFQPARLHQGHGTGRGRRHPRRLTAGPPDGFRLPGHDPADPELHHRPAGHLGRQDGPADRAGGGGDLQHGVGALRRRPVRGGGGRRGAGGGVHQVQLRRGADPARRRRTRLPADGHAGLFGLGHDGNRRRDRDRARAGADEVRLFRRPAAGRHGSQGGGRRWGGAADRRSRIAAGARRVGLRRLPEAPAPTTMFRRTAGWTPATWPSSTPRAMSGSPGARRTW